MNKLIHEIKAIENTAEELYRICSYADTIATLSQTGEQKISPATLEVIFKDVAKVTEQASSQMYTLSKAIQTLN